MVIINSCDPISQIFTGDRSQARMSDVPVLDEVCLCSGRSQPCHLSAGMAGLSTAAAGTVAGVGATVGGILGLII